MYMKKITLSYTHTNDNKIWGHSVVSKQITRLTNFLVNGTHHCSDLKIYIYKGIKEVTLGTENE